MKAFLGCDIGRVRQENQDSLRAEAFADGVLALVCDGMGGMQNGSTASKIAVAAAEEYFCANYQTGMPAEEVCDLLRASAADANQKVCDKRNGDALEHRIDNTLNHTRCEQRTVG